MDSTSKLLRILSRVTVGLIAPFVLFNVVLRIETYRFRLKAEHMMADIQSLKLRQSNWLDADRLIVRWGKYGHYQGQCDDSFCRYSINLESPEAKLESMFLKYPSIFRPAFLLLAVYEHLGDRAATVRATFVVQDGVVLRKSAVFIYSVPPAFSDPHGYLLIATSRSISRLSLGDWPLSANEQLAKHPFYLVTKPGGCSNCMMANVTFAPDAPDSEIRRLTTFDLSCITRLRTCRYIEDIYPAAEAWHLYDGTYGAHPADPKRVSDEDIAVLHACRIPIFVLGREAEQILSVTALSEFQERKPGELIERATVRLDGVLKGSLDYKPSTRIPVVSDRYDDDSALRIEIPLIPGERFLLLSLYPPQGKSHPFELERCFALPDTPEIRSQLEQGMAQNDSLRYPDPHFSWFIPD